MLKNVLRFFGALLLLPLFLFSLVQAEEMNGLRNAEPENFIRNMPPEQEMINEIKINPNIQRADVEEIRREEHMTRIKIGKGLVIKLPDGKRTSIKDILENGDIALENGLELTPDGYALSGDFAGKRIIAPEEAGDAPQKNAGQSEDAPEKKAASESAQSESKIETIAEIVTSMPAMMKAAQSGGKKQGEAKKTGPKNVASGNSKAKKATAKKSEPNAQNRRLYIPPEDAKKRSVAFMNGCWKGGSVDYSTKRKVTICFCFRNSKGTGKIYDPGFFGTTSAPALAKILLMGSFGFTPGHSESPRARRFG